jgi:hypothetical protein
LRGGKQYSRAFRKNGLPAECEIAHFIAGIERTDWTFQRTLSRATVLQC